MRRLKSSFRLASNCSEKGPINDIRDYTQVLPREVDTLPLKIASLQHFLPLVSGAVMVKKMAELCLGLTVQCELKHGIYSYSMGSIEMLLTEGTCCPLETSDSHVLSNASVSLDASLASALSSWRYFNRCGR